MNASSSDDAPRARILLADEHLIFLQGLERLLSDSFDVVGIVTTGDDLVRVALKEQPDLIVTDYSMSGLNGLDAVDRIRHGGGFPKVVVLTMHLDPEYASRAISRGVDAYVLKQSASDELVSAIKEALVGGRWLSPALAAGLLEREASKQPLEASPIAGLTGRQREVLNLLVSGKIAKEIAVDLHISRKTVEYHKYRMMNELGVATSAELIKMAVQNGVTGG